MNANRICVILGTALLLATATQASAGGDVSAFYTMTSGPAGDGFTWPASPGQGGNGLLDNDTFITPDIDVNFGNFSGNSSFFDSQYQVAAIGNLINGDAWWGNGNNVIELGFINTLNEAVDTVSLDFAWSQSGSDVSDFFSFSNTLAICSSRRW